MSDVQHHPAHANARIPEPSRMLDVVMDDGAIVRVRRHGNPAGPRVMLSHGNGLAIDAYFPFWSLMLPRYDVIVFDFRNHGENPLHGGAHHDLEHFVSDMERVWQETQREFDAKPAAGLFHSLSALAAIRHALEHPDRWRALVLFDPPIYPREGHPLRNSQQSDKDSLAERARRRTERYRSPHEFAQQLASRAVFKRWRPEAYELMAHATLRRDEHKGDWILACPRELEARVFSENRDPTLWTRLGAVKVPVKLIGADPNLPEAGPPARIAKAIGEEIPIEYESIPDTTHFLQVERPEACLVAVERFLAKHGMAP